MSEMSSRWLWALPVRGRYGLGALAAALLAVGCGRASGPSSSSSSHWLVCQEDIDCASLGQAARCDDGGYCANADGRISLPIEGAAGSSAAGDGGAAGGGGGAEPGPTSGGTNGEGGTSCTGATCSACPAPRVRTDVTCQPETYWARDPDSGACCVYENLCVAPDGWPLFSSEEECQTSCRCAVVEPFEESDTGGLTLGVERISLECRCADGGCPGNVQAATAEWCEAADNFGYQVMRYQGCGMIAIVGDGGFSGGQVVFDEGTGALVGTSSYSDVPSLPCQTFTRIAGQEFECGAVTMCQLCGPSEAAPPCD